MEVYLVRHTRPAIAEGICYGRSDIGLAETFAGEAAAVKAKLPEQAAVIYSSPLARCKQLADALFPGQDIQLCAELGEIHFGNWEMRPWSGIPPDELNPWMQDFVQARPPGGETYLELYARVMAAWERIVTAGKNAVVITHAGVIRCILSHIYSTELESSFRHYQPGYGEVIHLQVPAANAV